MSFQAAKRRRIDHATSTLSKPFKSPLRKQVHNTPTDSDNEKADTVPKSEARISNTSAKSSVSTSSIQTPRSINPPCTPSTALKRSAIIPPTRPPTTVTASRLLPSPSALPELLSLQKQHSTLTTRLTSLRMELDTVTQALKVERSGQDAELEVLVAKWKVASREAAEELFIDANERVKRMGGVKGWRATAKMAQESRAGWDDHDRDVSVGGELGSEEEEFERRRAGMEGEIEGSETEGDSRDGDEGKEGEGDEDESFTMDMMLKSLNIELDIIGFDKETQQWT